MNVLTTAVRNSTMFQTIFMCSLDDNVFNPLSPNSDRVQFSLNDINTLSRVLVMRIYKMNTYCFALIFYQILSTHSLRKYIKISLENLYVDIMVTYCIFTFFQKKKSSKHRKKRVSYCSWLYNKYYISFIKCIALHEKKVKCLFLYVSWIFLRKVKEGQKRILLPSSWSLFLFKLL